MFDEETITRACAEANREAAQVMMRRQHALSRLLPDISSVSRLILRHQWHPYRIYKGTNSWGLELQVEDPLVRIAMRDEETYRELREIGTQMMMNEMTSQSFLTALLTREILGSD